MTENKFVIPSAFDIKSLAERGLDDEMIAAEFDLLEREFRSILRKNPELKRALVIGRIKAKTRIHNALWDSPDVGLLLLKARMHLRLSDPVLDEQAGSLFKKILSKADNKTRETLASVLNLKYIK